MNVETLIYAYLAVCFSMIVFNCVCIFAFKRGDKKISKRSTEFENRILEQIEQMKQGNSPDEEHKNYLRKKLKKTGNLTALDETVERLFAAEPDAVKVYLTAIFPVFIYLSMEYQKRDEIRAAYFPYVITRFGILKDQTSGVMLDSLFELLHSESLYCRENALQAIYSTGDCGCVATALKIIDSSKYFHHSKLLTDGMLEFSGSHESLSAALWEEFDTFSNQMKVTILNYFRFSGSNCCEKIMGLLSDTKQDDEIRFSCIRYFGKYRYEPVFSLLLDFAENADKRRWEYAAISSSALGIYPSERTIQVLKRNLNSSNWYIRFNASTSLEMFGLTYTDLIDIFDGNDRYAREILQYRLDQRNAKKKEEVKA